MSKKFKFNILSFCIILIMLLVAIFNPKVEVSKINICIYILFTILLIVSEYEIYNVDKENKKLEKEYDELYDVAKIQHNLLKESVDFLEKLQFVLSQKEVKKNKGGKNNE